ncbi:hypothetical protein PROFUN_02544 [Planoprotostelium fungivorum]|uniref:Queuine tRNA-ribosyltransferase accessory subunit 2 n=1 Tax=Planoprotostelium fungivorum TaxID=1890364 RepID=A0A2P6MPD4_9EUKA|nr:hypothetical protein PROFUN_02544 [Planoprotostelium fungivorum]
MPMRKVEWTPSVTEGEARTGCLSIVRVDEQGNHIDRIKKIDTPCFFLGSRAGAPPNFTVDIWNEFKKKCNAVQIEAETISQFGRGIHDFIAVGEKQNNFRPRGKPEATGEERLTETAIYLSFRDPLNYNSICNVDGLAVSNDAFSFVVRQRGKMKLTTHQGVKLLKDLDGDLIESISMDVPYHVTSKKMRRSVDVSIHILDKILESNTGNVLGVIQGGSDERSRTVSAKETAKRNVCGFVLGSFGLGEDLSQQSQMIRWILPHIPAEKVRFIPGIGTPLQILEAVSLGCDVFNSDYPHLIGEYGQAIIFSTDASVDRPYKINLRDRKFQLDQEPILKGCTCYGCQNHTRAYVCHLLATHEMLANVLLSVHNCWHYLEFFREMRESIGRGGFNRFKETFLERYYSKAEE